ncbi:RIP metalloprotease RseP [Chitinophaga sancti]|uniref:Zinc metalloprotease n=1 Tax=Chitinophaga sancti TaxID=1004 RepID=A0A1K1PRI9_9BACT|nr:RIP metalloprotease RseP [Chitinophaga sancti]WQD61742.1 RIP metalloprotease RseP [Chitinophaga sancti]WQG92700.1 RIP metalloprotease RseP [Chitinophaga sancti]SFW50061.1 regulator of sigma E protease [Chitinophaga sancti]
MTTAQILVKAAQLILSLSILVVLHELGHFIPAKLFKTRVEKFYLFFDPWFSLFKFRKGETEYGIGWLPLGGYVKISGMVDESMDREQLAKPPEDWEFRSKKAWQRLIIMIGGVTVNLLLGFLIYSMMLWHWGETYLPTANTTYGVAVDSLGQSIGLKDGDMILGVENQPVENFKAVPGQIILRQAKTIQISRDGQKMDIAIPDGVVGRMIKNKLSLVDVRVPFLVDTIVPKMAADSAGIRKGDQLLTLNGQPAYYYHQFKQEIEKDKNKVVPMQVLRGEDTVTLQVHVPEAAVLGFNVNPEKMFTFSVKHFSFFEAIPAGFKKCINTLVGYVQQLRLIFVSKEVKASESLGGFMTIANLFPGAWDWMAFWEMTALLSIILAFMNILPIPALDGGHVLFLIYEMVTGRKPSEKFLEYAQIVGMVILFGLLLYANGLDIYRRIFGK